MSDALARARLLLGRRRPDLAERELRDALAADPGDAEAHTLLALALGREGRLEEARSAAREGVRLAPDDAWAHHILGCVLLDSGLVADALHHARQAVALDPHDAGYHALLGAVEMACGHRRAAAAEGERGLALDPGHTWCARVRAHALVLLGEGDRAADTLRRALATDPGDADLHALRGLHLLHAGRAAEAAASYREALRLEPRHEQARRGLVRALKARNPVLRVLQRLDFWLDRQPSVVRILFWAGAISAYPALRAVASDDVALWLNTGGVLAVLAVFLTWIYSDAFLLLDPVGRRALSPREARGAGWLAGGTAAALAAGAAGALAGGAAVLAGLFAPFVATSLYAAAEVERGPGRTALLAFAVLHGLTALAFSVRLAWLGWESPMSPADPLLLLAVLVAPLGVIGARWIFRLRLRP